MQLAHANYGEIVAQLSVDSLNTFHTYLEAEKRRKKLFPIPSMSQASYSITTWCAILSGMRSGFFDPSTVAVCATEVNPVARATDSNTEKRLEALSAAAKTWLLIDTLLTNLRIL